MNIGAAQRRRSLVTGLIALAVLIVGEVWLVREMVRTIDHPAVQALLTGVGTFAATGALVGDRFTRRAIDGFEGSTGWRLGRVRRDSDLATVRHRPELAPLIERARISRAW